MKNIVLLGGSNCVMRSGIQAGLKDFSHLTNLALGGSTSLQNLYELKRTKNENAFKNADCIVTESSLNEIEYKIEPSIPTKIIFRNAQWFYEELFYLEKKIVILLLPLGDVNDNFKVINNIHRQMCLKYGFNLIDMQSYYELNDLVEFGERIDRFHQLESILYQLGKNIALNIDKFSYPKKLTLKKQIPTFEILTPKQMGVLKYSLYHKQNSMYDEYCYKIKQGTKLYFPLRYKDYTLIGLSSWNDQKEGLNEYLNYSSLVIKNQKQTIVKENNLFRNVLEICTDFKIDEKSFIYVNDENLSRTRIFHHARSYEQNSRQLDYINLIDFFLAKNNGNFYEENIDFENLENKNYEIPKEYDFNFLIPPVEVYKEIIDEYCSKMYPQSLQEQIHNLNQKIIFLQNANHKALRIKEHLSYRIGFALIKAYKNIWGGGLLKFLFIDLPRIKKEFKRKKKNDT